jgi:hypothetical protein
MRDSTRDPSRAAQHDDARDVEDDGCLVFLRRDDVTFGALLTFEKRDVDRDDASFEGLALFARQFVVRRREPSTAVVLPSPAEDRSESKDLEW